MPVNFIRHHVLMDTAVASRSKNSNSDGSNNPIFVSISHGERITSITSSGEKTILVGTSRGRLLKILVGLDSQAATLIEASQVRKMWFRGREK